MSRREFDRKSRVAIIKRATHLGLVHCEICGMFLKAWEFHHKDMDALQVDKSRKLTADDGLLVCKPCHKIESAKQAPILAKALAQEARHLGARRPKQAMPKGPKLRGPKRKHDGREPLPPRRIYEEV